MTGCVAWVVVMNDTKAKAGMDKADATAGRQRAIARAAESSAGWDDATEGEAEGSVPDFKPLTAEEAEERERERGSPAKRKAADGLPGGAPSKRARLSYKLEVERKEIDLVSASHQSLRQAVDQSRRDLLQLRANFLAARRDAEAMQRETAEIDRQLQLATVELTQRADAVSRAREDALRRTRALSDRVNEQVCVRVSGLAVGLGSIGSIVCVCLSLVDLSLCSIPSPLMFVLLVPCHGG